MIVRISLFWKCSLCLSCRVRNVLRPKNDTCFFMIGNALIDVSAMSDLSDIVSWVVVCCDVAEPSLGTENKLSLLHLRFQLCPVNCASVRGELLVSLAWVRLVNRRLVRATKLEITRSQIRTWVNRSICYNRPVLSWTTAFVSTLESKCTLRSGCNTTMGYINITGCNWNFFYHFYWGWLAGNLLLKTFIGT